MDFGAAFQHLKAGRCVARSAWPAQGLALCLLPGLTFKVAGPPLLGVYPNGADARLHACLAMSVGDGLVVVWQPSQPDMLADDWLVVSAESPAGAAGVLD